MAKTITLIEGDGIGPEVVAAAIRILQAAGAEFDWDRQVAGQLAVDKGLKPLPDELIDSIKSTGIGFKGPVTTPVGGGFRSVNVELRKTLDLYANLRPVRSLPGIAERFTGVDLVVVRENTEGLYSGIEHQVVEGVVESLKIITRKASTRIAKFAFEHARKHGRRRVTAVHKANIMKLSDGLFLQCVREVAEDYPEIECDDRIVDAMSMHLVIRPETYDVLVLPNLYGDIVSDLAAGLVGGLGIVPGANIGELESVFEAVHGSAPDIAGQDIANPTAVLRSGVLMLRHLGMNQEAERISTATLRLFKRREHLTRDVGGNASTTEFTDAVIREMEAA